MTENITEVEWQRMHQNYRAGLYKYDTAGVKSAPEWIFFLILCTKSFEDYLVHARCQVTN